MNKCYHKDVCTQSLKEILLNSRARDRGLQKQVLPLLPLLLCLIFRRESVAFRRWSQWKFTVPPTADFLYIYRVLKYLPKPVHEIPSLLLGGEVDFYPHLSHVLKVQKPP